MPDGGSSARGRVRVGISGWTYAGWRGVFYPADLPRKRELEYAGGMLDSVEINGSFYSLQRPTSYRSWYEATPDGFVFAVKGSRFITHMKRLNEVEVPLANLFASGLLRLADKLGPMLWQFPERFRFDPPRFARFLELLPRSHAQAARLASLHDHRLEGRSWTEPLVEAPILHAFEVRHESFLVPEFVAMLRAHDAALVFADTARRWPYAEDVTASFAYVRLHGAQQLYASGYTDDELDWWASRVRAWAAGSEPGDAVRVSSEPPPLKPGRDVYVYFDNDAKVRAPFDAMRLMKRVR